MADGNESQIPTKHLHTHCTKVHRIKLALKDAQVHFSNDNKDRGTNVLACSGIDSFASFIDVEGLPFITGPPKLDPLSSGTCLHTI